MQENYDAIGRWRTTDNGLPIDAEHLRGFPRRGAASTPARPSTRSRASPTRMRFKQCFVRQLFRFYMGRDEVVADDPLLRRHVPRPSPPMTRRASSSCCARWPPRPASHNARRPHDPQDAEIGRAHASRPDQTLRVPGVRADARRSGDGIHRRRHVRGRPAVRDVLHRRLVLSGVHQSHAPSPVWPGPRSRPCSRTPRTSFCSRT